VIPLQPTGGWRGESFAHEAFVFNEDTDVIARCMPFVEEGLERDEPVIVVATERVRRVIIDALGADVVRLALLAPAETWWRGGHATLHAYDRDLRVLRKAGKPWRLIGEPVWLGHREGRVWSRFEAVANTCYASYPYYSLCLHDRRRLDQEVIDQVLRTHPLVWDGSAPTPSPTYENTHSYLRSVEPAWSARPSTAITTAVTDPRQARIAIRDACRLTDWSPRADDIALALHELVINALRVSDTAEISSWTVNGDLVWEVSDSGPGLHEATAGYVPPDDAADGGRGLWLARSIADDASVRAWGPGTAIRLFFRV
jgi:anti-sigma regulatory factor (Ser/Thr protein kinase)